MYFQDNYYQFVFAPSIEFAQLQTSLDRVSKPCQGLLKFYSFNSLLNIRKYFSVSS